MDTIISVFRDSFLFELGLLQKHWKAYLLFLAIGLGLAVFLRQVK